VALLAGVVLAYLQMQKSVPPPTPPKLPVASIAKPTAGDPPRQLTIPEVSPPIADAFTPPPIPARLPPEPVTPSPTPNIPVAPPVPCDIVTFSGVLPSDGGPVDVAPPLLPDDGKLWTRSMHLELDQSTSGGSNGKLTFLNKKPDDAAAPSLSVSNMSDVGTQYRFLKNGDTTFLGLVGGGFSKDYARLAEGQRIPEVLFGFQFEHQITQRHKILGGVEYARDVTDVGRYRVRTQAAWEVLLDAEKNVSLRTGVLENSNTAPSGEQAKNLNYTLDFIWKF